MTDQMTSNIASHHAIRAELESMVLKDLLGPAGGEHEEITERSVRDRYLVGVLAPSKTVQQPPQPSATTPTTTEDEDDETPLIPDELSEGGTDSSDDGNTDTSMPVTQGFLPSSFGLTFCVEPAIHSLKVEARWGHYKREIREEQSDHQGKPLKVFQRHPRGGTVEVALAEGTLEPLSPDPEFPEVLVQGRIRKRDSYWVITLFLVNAQEERKPKDECHIFQPRLIVEAVDGKAGFLRHGQVSPHDDLEERLTAMLYRNLVEFAVGHGVSVKAAVADQSPDRALRLETEVIPAYEVPRTAPPTELDAGENPAFAKLAGLALDMKTLAEADTKRVPKLLEPLAQAYAEWIDGEEAKTQAPNNGLAAFGNAPSVAIKNCRLTLERIREGITLVAKDPKAMEAFQFMNRAMHLQRTYSILSERVRRGRNPSTTKKSTCHTIGAGARSSLPLCC